MKRLPDQKTTSDELPSFLDEPTPVDAAGEAAGEPAIVDQGEAEASLDSAAPEGAQAEPARSRSSRRPATASRPATAGPAAGGALAIGGGVAALLAAVGLGVATLQGIQMGLADRLGATPFGMFLFGSILVATGFVRRRIATVHTAIEASGSQRTSGHDALQEGIQFLVSAHHDTAAKAPAAGEELQHVLVTLQRQDEKINNLTKAIKMYGKPLMEISGQGTELAGSLAQIKTAVEAAAEVSRQANTRLESQLRSSGNPKQELAELQDGLRKLTAAVGSLGDQPAAMPSLEPLQQQLVRIDVGVQALAQRLENSEVQKSLLRLEEAQQKARSDVQQLLRGESVEKATAQLQKQLEGTTARLSDGLLQLRDGNLGGIETTVREIQREVAGVATSIAQIQAVVKQSGGRLAPSSSAPAAAPAPGPAPTPAPAAQPAPAAAPAPSASAPAEAKEGVAGYQTGTRTTASKNVLGAIAKLKQMKN